MVMYDNDHHAWAGCGAEVAWRWREVQFKFPPKCFGYSTKSYVGVDTLLKFSPSSPFSVVRTHEISLDDGNLRQVSITTSSPDMKSTTNHLVRQYRYLWN